MVRMGVAWIFEKILKTTTEFQLVHVTKLVPYVNNARTHSPEQINKVRIYRQNPSVQAKMRSSPRIFRYAISLPDSTRQIP